MITSRKKHQSCKPCCKWNGAEITPELSVSLLGIEIDDKLNFGQLFSDVCIKASRQLNATCRLKSSMNQKWKETIHSIVYSNFNHSLLTFQLHFTTKKSHNKTEKI